MKTVAAQKIPQCLSRFADRELLSMKFDCLYCSKSKPAVESTLEHAIPQFLGGAQAPMQYKIRNVCGDCNSGLGLHVDGSFAKSWFVSNALAEAARKYYSGPKQKQSLPLICLGSVNITNLVMQGNNVSESWLGPSGETIIWVREKDESFYWYTGGNPAKRKTSSTVYFIPVSNDPFRFQMAIEALHGFCKKTKARRILGVNVMGLAPGNPFPGFDLPTPTDIINVEIIRNAMRAGSIHGQLQFNLKFDQRFICKMALAIGFSLFGESYLGTKEAKEARVGLWPDPKKLPKLRVFTAVDAFSSKRQLPVYEGAIIILVTKAKQSYFMSLSISREVQFTVELCSDTLSSKFVSPDLGYALILFPQLQQCVESTMHDLLAHLLGQTPHPKLSAIDRQRQKAAAFWESLPASPTAKA